MHRKADTLYPGIVGMQAQARHVFPPLFAAHLLRGGKQCARAAQHLAIGLEALFDPEGDPGRFEQECAFAGLVMGLFDAADGEVPDHACQHKGNERGTPDRAQQAGRLFPCECLHVRIFSPRKQLYSGARQRVTPAKQ